MLFMVEMDVNVPLDYDADRFAQLKQAEKERFQELQRAGTWRHIWRVVGHYSNVSIFDVESGAALHDILAGLPLYPFNFGDDPFAADDFAFGTREGLLPVPNRQGDSAYIAFDFKLQRSEEADEEGFSHRVRASA